MFDKIKGKLKSVFSKSEKIFDEEKDNKENVHESVDIPVLDNELEQDVQVDDIKSEEVVIENNDIVQKSNDKTKKKGFLESIFKKKDEKVDENDTEKLSEEVVLDNKEPLAKQDTGFSLIKKNIKNSDFDKIWIDLEIFLLEINIAYDIVQKIRDELEKVVVGNSFNRFSLNEKIKQVMISETYKVLKSRESDMLVLLKKIKEEGNVAKILIVGVNGTGKTTTIAKIVHLLKENNLSVVVSASDTFRAGAIDQLEEHSKKLGFKMIKHQMGSDPAAVAYDTVEHARSKKIDVVIVDTAGRMPNNANLMNELFKVHRILNPDINLFIGDSVSGNDLIDQIELFDKIVNISGIILTKVDTDEKPGSVVSAAYSIKKPIYYLGNGQGYSDLVKFDAQEISNKLFDD